MIDPTALATGAIEIFRHHAPWLAEKLGAAAATQAVKEAWEQVKKRLSSPGGQETIGKVESEPETDRNWEMLRLQLAEAMEKDTAFREQLAGLVESQPVRQEIHGDYGKQAAITGSPGASIKM